MEIYPVNSDEYAYLHECGADCVTLFQETYNSDKYETLHLAGHIFATDCKKDLPPRGLEFLKEVCNSVTIPVYAIGGIKLSDVQMDEIIKCGAKGGCIMSGMMSL